MNFSVKKANLKNIIFKIRHTLFVLERRWRCHPFLGRFYPKKAIYRRALAVFLAFIVLVPSVFLVFRPQKASADWFDDDYAYRQNFSFIHNADISTERAVTFSLDTATLISAGVMQADCDDTRFTDNNGKVLRYQLTGTCNNAATTYEVVFPSIINGSNVGIVYYGNPQALSHSENVSSVTALTPSGGDPTITTRTNEEKAPSPALSLKFDEGYGQTANDTSSNRKNATLGTTANSDTNDPVWQTEDMCINGKCLKFDGTDDYMEGSDTALPSGANPVTISAWFKMTQTSVSATVFSYGTSTTSQARGIQFRNDTTMRFFGWGNDFDVTVPSIGISTWHHVAVVYDGTNARIYFDGMDKGSIAKTWNTVLSGVYRVGRSPGTGTNYFTGFIDDVRVYNYARSSSQIKTDAASRIPSVHGISASFGDDQSYLSNGLVGYWKMDDGVNNPCASGVDKACDSSGNGNVGTWTGGVASTSGKFGNALNFDGVNDYTSMGDPSIVDFGSGDFTINAWVKLGSLTQTRGMIVAKDNNPGRQFTLEWDADDNNTNKIRIAYFTTNDSTWVQGDTANNAITDTNWHYVTGGRSGNNLFIYIDGINQNITTNTTYGSPGAMQATNANLQIGARSYGGAEDYFNGSIDDVRIYNRTLSPSEITRLYDWAPGPVGWWKMDENTGTIANDSSGNGNTGGISKPAAMANWTYKLPLTVTNSGSDLTDYQASVSANTSVPIAAGKMQSDCDDVRFYDSDNTTALNYWIEPDSCNIIDTRFWVKIPSIPSGSKTIYMYYGNTSATAASDHSATFVDFVDYDDAAGWLQDPTYGNGTKSNPSGKITNFYSVWDANAALYYHSILHPYTKITIETVVKQYDTSQTNDQYVNWIADTGDYATGNMFKTIDVSNQVGNGQTVSFNSWYKYIIKIDSTNANGVSWYRYNPDGSLNYSSENGAFDEAGALNQSISYIGIGKGGGSTWGTSADYKYWIIRKYATTEPTVTAGSETTGAIPWTHGKFGSSLKFDGVDDYVSVATTSSILNFERNNAFSISGWIKTSSTAVSVFSKMANSAPYTGYDLLVDTTGKLALILVNTWTSNAIRLTSSQFVNDGTWKFVTATYDGSSDAAGVKIYINGIQDTGATSDLNSLTTSMQNSLPITIGSRQQSRYVNGAIDDVRVYDYVRTPKQIIQDMNGGHPSVGSPVGSAVAQWNFDEGFGTTVHNSGNCATCSGTLTNMDSPATYGSGWTQSGKFGKALNFDGVNDYVDAGTGGGLDITGSITLSAWVKKQELSRIESIVSKSPYSLKIGADAKPYMELIAGDETIADVGQLGSNASVYSLAVYDGKLYGGTATTGYVYRYDGGTTWTSVGQLGSTSYVYSLAVYDGKLYGGSSGSGGVYRYDGGTTWTSVGQLGSMSQVASLAVFDGKLYGGSGNGGEGHVYRYDGGTTWTDTGQPQSFSPVTSLVVYNGKLYAGVDTSNTGNVYRYDGGTTWTSVGTPGSAADIYSMVVYDGNLYAGCTCYGNVYRYDGGTTWTSVGGTASYASSLAVYDGKLYVGNSNNYVYRYNGGTSWTSVGTLGSSDRIYSLTVYDGKLYGATGNTTGKVYSIGTGLSVYSGTAIGNEFSHISAAYDGATARIFINGVEKGTRSAAVTIGGSSDHLLIGASKGTSQGGYSSSGEEYFSGTLDSVSIYNYALNSQEIKVNYNRGKGIVMGALSTNPDGSATNSAARSYCLPGNSEGNCAAGSDPAPVAHWTLDENTGTTANDSSGNANTGTLTNGPAWTPGKIGSALYFDGVNDYVDAGNRTSLSLTGNFTISAWINTKDISENVHVIYDAGGGNILYTQWNYVYFQKNNTWETIQSSATINTNAWYHVVVTKSGTGAGNTKLYINGVQGDNAAAIPNLSITTNSYIGAEVTPMRYFNGSIDDVRVYNYARTAAQVAWDYNRGRPLGWWKFDEGQGLTAHDASGNGNNGTIIGSPRWTYRMPFTITNSGSALTDYQASVSASTSTPIAAGKMQADCDDVRFYDSDGTTALNYWLESNCNNPTTGAVFWVKIPSIPSGSKTIYMYYGNPGASAGSNGANTFQFFDGFDGSSLDGTKWPSQAGSITVSGGELHIDILANVGHAGFLAQNSTGILTFKGKYSADVTVMRMGTNSENTIGMYGNGTYVYLWEGSQKNFGASGPDIYHKYTFAYKGAAGIDHYFDYKYSFNRTDTNNIGTYYFGNYSQESARNGDVWIDWVYIRKYAATEPTATAGNETTAPATAGKFNSALNFDGVDDYVDTTSTTAFNFERTQPFSVGAWIKSTYSGSSYILIASNMHATNLAGWEFFVDATRPGDKHLGLALLNSGPTEYLYAKDSTAFNLLDNQWHYVLATYDGSSSINGIKLYIDGIYKTTTKDNGADSLTSSILSNTSLKIGQQGTSSPYWFLGSIDDVRVYNYVLTPTQIKTLYNGDSAVRFGPATGSP